MFIIHYKSCKNNTNKNLKALILISSELIKYFFIAVVLIIIIEMI